MSEHPARRRVVASDPLSIELALRAEWWLNHGTSCMPYGDDGQMQCCGVDFLRHPIEDLQQRVEDLRFKRLQQSVGFHQSV